MSVAKTILKRLFRVYAHIYHQHFDSVMRLQEEAHLNTSFKHFIFFVQVRPRAPATRSGFSFAFRELDFKRVFKDGQQRRVLEDAVGSCPVRLWCRVFFFQVKLAAKRLNFSLGFSSGSAAKETRLEETLGLS